MPSLGSRDHLEFFRKPRTLIQDTPLGNDFTFGSSAWTNDWLARSAEIVEKYFAMEEHSAVLDLERGQLSNIRTLPWQTDTSVGNKSWGYIENDTFKSPEFIVHQLVDIVSKNGNLLLNIGAVRRDDTG